MGLPFPDALDELLAAEIVLLDLPLGQLVRDDDLGGDAGMVGAGLPQRVAAAHALEADRTSCKVKVSACPMCRLPVTFGGGIMTVKGGLLLGRVGGEGAGLSHASYRRVSTVPGR